MGNCLDSTSDDKYLNPPIPTYQPYQNQGPSARSPNSVTTGKASNASTSSSTYGRSIGSSTSEGSYSYSDGKILETPNLRVFTFAELKGATRNFRPDTILGEGGFGSVYKGYVDEKTLTPAKSGLGMVVAVKKLNPESMQGLQEWQSEVNFLGRLSHPNLVKLLGYCWEDKELLLVYEYMSKGSLENHLFRNELLVKKLCGVGVMPVGFGTSNAGSGGPWLKHCIAVSFYVLKGGAYQPLSWNLRLKIAIGAARGLAFLHSAEKHVIYRDFKASNILLDSNFNAKLSDFGLAKPGPTAGNTHVTTRVMGTYGYAAPEYVATGHLYVKSDVYGFGVVLLEMLTGLRALDSSRPSDQHNLVDWGKPYLSDRRKLARLLDPRLEGRYPSKGAVLAAQLTLRCLSGDPKSRPSMKEVLTVLEEIESMKMRPKEGGGASPRPGAGRNDRGSSGLGPGQPSPRIR